MILSASKSSQPSHSYIEESEPFQCHPVRQLLCPFHCFNVQNTGEYKIKVSAERYISCYNLCSESTDMENIFHLSVREAVILLLLELINTK